MSLRDADLLEMKTITDRPVLELIEYGVEMSLVSKVARVDGQLLCMWGVGVESAISGIGRPWLLGTDLMFKHPHVFLNGSKAQLKPLLGRYRYLRHFVDKRNKVSIRWLKWLGFKVGEGYPLGRSGEIFYEFTMGEV